MSDLPFIPETSSDQDAWTDEAFASPLDEVPGSVARPGDRALRWSLASMVLVITAVAVPLLGSLPPLPAAM